MLLAVAIAVALPWATLAILRLLALDAGHPLVSIVAFTPYAALTAPLPIVVALLLRKWWVALAATVTAVALVATVGPRALDDDRPGGLDDRRRLTVMSANLFRGQADAATVMRLARSERVDVLSLQELDAGALTRLDAAGAGRMFPRRAIALAAGGGGSGLLVGRHARLLGTARTAGADQPAVTVALPGSGALSVEAVHPPPPIGAATGRTWRSLLEALPSAGEGAPLRVLAGDFNATLDHRALREVLDRGYVDAADAAGSGLEPTWRSGPLPITIDHVLVDRRIGVRDFSTHEVPGSDHEAVVAELTVPGLPRHAPE